MREFTDIQHEPRLLKYSDSPLGTLYMILDTSGIPKVMIRHFDRNLPVELVKPFADLMKAAQRWIEHRPELARIVRVEQPIEVARDFIARPYHIFYTSTDAYVNWENPPEPPDELKQMRRAFCEAIGKSAEPRDAIIEAVLTRSLIDPTIDTYFNEIEGKFIIVEPTLIREDVERWAALSTSASG